MVLDSTESRDYLKTWERVIDKWVNKHEMSSYDVLGTLSIKVFFANTRVCDALNRRYGPIIEFVW